MGSIAVVGVQHADSGALDERAVACLREADEVICAGEGVAADTVRALGISPVMFADLGLAADAPAELIVETLIERSSGSDVALVSAGYPFVRAGVLSGLLARTDREVRIFPVSSPLQVLLLALDIDLTADVTIVDAESLGEAAFVRDMHLIVTGVSNAVVARAVGKRLASFFAPEHTVVIATSRVSGGFELDMSSVGELAAYEGACRDAALFVAPSRIEPPGGFDELVRIVRVLRGPDGCPWDREQTHETLAKHMIEEAYEAVHAIQMDDLDGLADELGDVLLQVVLHAQIGAEAGAFTIDDVVANIIAKIRRRHPHVFGAVRVDDAAQVMANWEAIKHEEREGAGAAEGGVLAGVTPALPALMYAQKLSRRAAAAGFEWDGIEGVLDKVAEEIAELKACPPGSPEAADEVGDLLFTIVNVARHLGIDAEVALRGTCAKFKRRFEAMEARAAEMGTDVRGLRTEEYERLWALAKETEVTPRGEDGSEGAETS